LRRYRRSDQLTRPRDGLGLGATGQQTVVPDPVEPVWQDVDEEAADELARLERHGFVAARAFDPVVLVAERDAGSVGRDQATVGDSDAVGVARKIAQDLLRSPKWTLGIPGAMDAVSRSGTPSSIVCARALSGSRAPAPTNAMNSRRLIQSPRRRTPIKCPVPVYRVSLPCSG